MVSSNSKPPDDELSARLRESLRKRRPWLLTVVMLVLCCGGPLALFAWYFMPRGEPAAPIALVAFDQCAVAGTDAAVHAQVVSDQDKRMFANAGGIKLLFAAGARRLDKNQVQQAQAVTDDHGSVQFVWPTPPGDVKVSDYIVRHVRADRRPSAFAQARIFNFSKNASCVLVDIDALTATPLAKWDNRLLNPSEFALATDAGATLAELAREHAIIYLAANAGQPWSYRRMRGWFDIEPRKELPSGPVLGRRSYAQSMTPAEAQFDAASKIRAQFQGEVSAIVADTDLAERLSAAKVRVYLLGRDKAPPSVRAVQSWSELRKEFQVPEKE